MWNKVEAIVVIINIIFAWGRGYIRSVLSSVRFICAKEIYKQFIHKTYRLAIVTKFPLNTQKPNIKTSANMSSAPIKIISFLMLVWCAAAEVTQSASASSLEVQDKTNDGVLPISSLSTLHLDASHHEHDNFTDFVRLADVLDIFNLEELARAWHQHESIFNHNCSTHMKEYFRALQKGHLWAVKSKFSQFFIRLIFPGIEYFWWGFNDRRCSCWWLWSSAVGVDRISSEYFPRDF